MKWNNPGHEYDNIYDQIKFTEDTKIALFGIGKIGIEAFYYLKDKIEIVGFFDNNQDKRADFLGGVPILPLSEIRKYKIVVSVSDIYYNEISMQLQDIGLKENVDFFNYFKFKKFYLPLLDLYIRDELNLNYMALTVSERCTLKCEKCCHGCNFVDVSDTTKDLTVEDCKKSIDVLLDTVDRLNELEIAGGETLFYENLPTVLAYLVNHPLYFKIKHVWITTNATLEPSKKLIDLCKKGDIGFNISDYSFKNPSFKRNIEKLIACLELNSVSYNILFDENNSWIDFGFRKVIHDDKKIIDFFDNCISECREIRNDRIYYCVMTRSNRENQKIDELGEDEYLDLTEIKDEEKKKKIIFEYMNGFSKKGYMNMCKMCNGMKKENNILVPPGVQMKSMNKKDIRDIGEGK